MRNQKYEEIAKILTKEPGVSMPTDRKGFGSYALWTAGKMFAFLSSKGEFVVKLPKERVDALEKSGSGKRCVIGQRPMKQWLAVKETDKLCLNLARESIEFVRSHGSSL